MTDVPARPGVATIASETGSADPFPDRRLPGGIAVMDAAGFVSGPLPWDDEPS